MISTHLKISGSWLSAPDHLEWQKRRARWIEISAVTYRKEWLFGDGGNPHMNQIQTMSPTLAILRVPFRVFGIACTGFSAAAYSTHLLSIYRPFSVTRWEVLASDCELQSPSHYSQSMRTTHFTLCLLVPTRPDSLAFQWILPAIPISRYTMLLSPFFGLLCRSAKPSRICYWKLLPPCRSADPFIRNLVCLRNTVPSVHFVAIKHNS